MDPLDEREQAITHVQQERVREAIDRDSELADLKGILADERVRDFLWRVLEKCRIYGDGYSRNFGDMAHMAGQRSNGLWILAEICEADPNAEMLMRQKSILRAHERARLDAEKRQRTARST